MWLQRPGSPIIMCHLQAREAGKLMVQFSLSLKAWDPRDCQRLSSHPKALEPGAPERWCPRVGGDECPSSKESTFALSIPFCSIQAHSSLVDSHPCWRVLPSGHPLVLSWKLGLHSFSSPNFSFTKKMSSEHWDSFLKVTFTSLDPGTCFFLPFHHIHVSLFLQTENSSFNKNSILFTFPDQTKTESPTVPLRCVVFLPLTVYPLGAFPGMWVGQLWLECSGREKSALPIGSASPRPLPLPSAFDVVINFVFSEICSSGYQVPKGVHTQKASGFVLVWETRMCKPPYGEW